MKKIVISGEIGWDVMPFMIREQIEGVTGDLEVDLSSPGGSVFHGIEIFNMFRDFKRENPDSQMILNIKGEAASMGSYIAANAAFDLITIEDNSTWMAHNPSMGVWGDHNEMAKGADFLKRLAGMMAPVYAKRSGDNIKDIQGMMDDETWLFGKEIVKAGFADEILSTKNKKTKASAIAESELKFKAVMKKVKEKEVSESDFEKIAAITKDLNKSVDKIDIQNNNDVSDLTAAGGNNNQEDIVKDIVELKEKHPEIHAEAIEAGKTQGITEEKERVKALLEMKNKEDFEGIDKIHLRIDEAIKNGENVNDVNVAIIAMSIKSGDVSAAIDTNDIGDLNTPVAKTVSGEVEKPSADDNAQEKEKENEVI